MSDLTEPALSTFDQLPYPVALTAQRMAESAHPDGNPLNALSALKDCFEATIKYLSFALLTEYFCSNARTDERSECIAEKLVRPSLGDWVAAVRDLSEWLIDTERKLGRQVSAIFTQTHQRQSTRSHTTEIARRCIDFVKFRNDVFGHGAMRPDTTYRIDLNEWLPFIRRLLAAVAGLHDWRLLLVADKRSCHDWMRPEPSILRQPVEFREQNVGHFVLRGPVDQAPGAGLDVCDLYPFLCCLPVAGQKQRLWYYDSIRFDARNAIRGVNILGYDDGSKRNAREPVEGLVARFTRDRLVRAATARRKGRIKSIEGRIVNFSELIAAHADIVGRRFAVDRVKRFIAENDRGLLLIEGGPGKGKTALMCNLIENVFADYDPPPVYFFYRRTEGHTDPDVCIKSLYAARCLRHTESRSRRTPSGRIRPRRSTRNSSIS